MCPPPASRSCQLPTVKVPRATVTSVLSELLAHAQERIAAAATAAGRDPADVVILVAVKARTAAEVAELGRAGARLIGHNRARGLEAMGADLAELPDAPTFDPHFSGRMQSDKLEQV